MIHAHPPQPQAAKVLSSNHNSALAMIPDFLTLSTVSYIIIFGCRTTKFFITQGQKVMGIFPLGTLIASEDPTNHSS
jgi:hypothetical protein